MSATLTKRVSNWVASLIIVTSLGGAMTVAISPQVVGANPPCNSSFLGFPAWYRGLTYDDSRGNPCAIKSPDSSKDGLSNFIWHIALNVVEIGLVAVAYISAIMTLYGGFLFITSQGKPDNATKARMTMLDAIIGLLISFAAIIVVDFIIAGLQK